MNPKKHLIMANGKIITTEVRYIKYNTTTKCIDIQFNTGKTYSYAYMAIKWLREPEVLKPVLFQIFYQGNILDHISAIYVFRDTNQTYWHIYFDNNTDFIFEQRNLHIIRSCLSDSKSRNVMEYLKQIAALSDLRNEDGINLLSKQYDRLGFVDSDTALASYLNPKMQRIDRKSSITPIFPFGCNVSQFQAVKNALENPISVIQGPPGTGKTQTILNIISNILIAGKTVLVVSNNNSATTNVLEKLASPKYNMGFLVAPLGKMENKKQFIQEQSGTFPDISSWRRFINDNLFFDALRVRTLELSSVHIKQERLAIAKQELSSIELELKYFKQYLDETDVSMNGIKLRRGINSKRLMSLWQECQNTSDKGINLSFLYKIKSLFFYGISNWRFYKQELSVIIRFMQMLFYDTKIKELVTEIKVLEKELLTKSTSSLINELEAMSMDYLKDRLFRKYGGSSKRRIFTEDCLWKDSSNFLYEYPIVLSTTFSSRSSLGRDIVYDYLIMDEASQVDVATGALALACAKNVVVVGDTKQLPNVVTDDTRKRSDAIFESFQIEEGYRYAGNSFLQSICKVIPNIPTILLREHYRCHPKIIGFCNQKFYNGELVIMTKDEGESSVISLIKTVKGNHQRDHYNQRQIDVIKTELLPNIPYYTANIGIIAPYNNQVDALEHELAPLDIDIATVHRFQGREKDAIILTTVDDDISDFVDDPYLLNVAVSRAKKSLYLVVSGNEQQKDTNIGDLISYIEYNNFQVTESKLYSVFDYLYRQYSQSRFEYLKKHKKISQYDSENLMYALIKEVLQENRYLKLDVVCHQPLNMLIRDPKLLDDKETKYAMNNSTHLDFLIYNRISKKPVLAIEVDGYEYHKESTVQAERDKMKDRILDLYEIPFIRFATNGSEERRRLIEKLDSLIT